MNRRGRLAPTPTGFLHVGHAYTFGIAAKRAAGELVFRVDDLDCTRCTDEYIAASIEDLQWLGLSWAEGPVCGGGAGPYFQSQRTGLYLEAWQQLAAAKIIYPSPHSRRDVEDAALAPHVPVGAEPLFPLELRPGRLDGTRDPWVCSLAISRSRWAGY
jgi:glutamyl-tRNA synthetase